MKNSVWLRLFFLFVVMQALLVASAMVQPDLIKLVFPWDASPLNARFIATLYGMGAISALLCMLAKSYTEVRISLIEIGLVTGALLLITIPHFGEFSADTFPYRWTIFYTIDPLVTGLILWRPNSPSTSLCARTSRSRSLIAWMSSLRKLKVA